LPEHYSTDLKCIGVRHFNIDNRLREIVDPTAKLDSIQGFVWQVSFGSHNLKLITILVFYKPLLLQNVYDVA